MQEEDVIESEDWSEGSEEETVEVDEDSWWRLVLVSTRELCYSTSGDFECLFASLRL